VEPEGGYGSKGLATLGGETRPTCAKAAGGGGGGKKKKKGGTK